MNKYFIIIFMITGIVSNAFSANRISFIVPDSPLDYKSNTWDEKNWTEIDVSNEGVIMDWSILYTWFADGYPDEASFHVLSPSGTSLTIASGDTSGTYTITSNDFNYEPVTGKWRLWIEDSYGDGGCGATGINMSIDIPDTYLLLTLPEMAVEGMESITGTVTANSIQDNDLIVALFSDNANRLYMPTTTTIKAGDDSANFSMTIVDDQLLNGSSFITILATAPDYYTGTDKLQIDDNESAVLTIALPYSATEGEQDVQGTIQISQSVDCDFYIPLISSDTNIITISENITFPKGLTEVVFHFSINDFNVEQAVSITSSVANWIIINDTSNNDTKA